MSKKELPATYGKAVMCGIPRAEEKTSRATADRTLNRTESLFWTYLRENCSENTLIISQPTRFFRFDTGDEYTPDFLTIEPREDGVTLTSWEVKGGYRGPGWEQGMERFKRAREYFSRSGAIFRLAVYDPKKKEWIFS